MFEESVNSAFSWTQFYMELADVVLKYKNNRSEFIQKVRQAYDEAGVEYKFYWNEHYFTDMDPFTFFGGFNKQLSDKTRIALLNQYKKEFALNAEVPSDFTGIPVLNNMRAWFTDDTQDERMETFWSLFEQAICTADSNSKQEVAELFDKAASFNGTSWNLTMGLFWIRPFTYIGLDANNRDKLVDQGLFDGKYPSGKDYIDLCSNLSAMIGTDDFPYSSFPDFSAQSWGESKEDDSSLDYKKWIIPLFNSLKALGRSANSKDVRKKILDEKTEAEVFETKKALNLFINGVTKAKNCLTYAGYIDKKKKTVWTLTEKADGVELDESMVEAMVVDYSKDSNQDNALLNDKSDNRRYWLYAPGNNADKWEEFYSKGMMGIGWYEIGDLQQYKSRDEMKEAMKSNISSDKSFAMDSLATWQFVHEMKPGDIVYVKKGLYKIIGRGVVLSDYEYIKRDDGYCNTRKVEWTHKGEWEHPGQAVMKTLTDISRYTQYIENLNSILEIDDSSDEIENTQLESYGPKQFLKEVYMDDDDYYNLTELISYKKNVILQGAPGVGKTFAAQRLAYSMIGKVDKNRVELVQFHQSYSYEDFIEGLRPTKTGEFEPKPGVFQLFCDKARDDKDNDYFFIIDEINRGNLSKIFGELFMLIENDKRGYELKLLYSGNSFSVPKNVYIIGMMNTADRSLAMLDYALRRRFVFFDMAPGFDSDGFIEYQKGLNNEKFDSLIRCVKELNEEIKKDDSLGEGFCIGHSYFCIKGAITEKMLENIVKYELIPLIKEYWFDNGNMVETWRERLCHSIGISQ